MTKEKSVSEFNADIDANAGYLYSTTKRLSCRIANQRITDAILDIAMIRGKRVIDIGCGDGTYTIELLQAGAGEVVGVDAAESAVECARGKAKGLNKIFFHTADIYSLGEPEKRYDIAILRGILHHLYEVEKAIRCISNVADEIIVLEPNGYNPALKILEKFSRYHVEHEEKSYSPSKLNQWFESTGGTVVDSRYIGFVPMFCPDFMAKSLKLVEPIVEAIPGVRNICCGQYLQKICMV